MIELADRYRLKKSLGLLSTVSSHRKYHPVERVCGILENHWNGTLLTDHETAVEWAKNITWKDVSFCANKPPTPSNRFSKKPMRSMTSCYGHSVSNSRVCVIKGSLRNDSINKNSSSHRSAFQLVLDRGENQVVQ